MFKQHATGSFNITVAGQWHCGLDTSPILGLRYGVTVKWEEGTHLDSHGFLIDNREFQKYFDGLHYTERSCELLAQDAADYFCKLIQERSPRGGMVDVDIFVPGLADIDFEETIKGHSSLARLKGEVG